MAFCSDCEVFLCEYCNDAHKRMKIFQDHQTVPSQKFEPEILKCKSKSHYCTQHPGKILQFYCNTCRKLVCNECVVNKQKPSLNTTFHFHDLRSIDDAVKATDISVKDLAQNATAEVKRFENHLQYIQCVEEGMEGYPAELKSIVNASIDCSIEQLQSHRAVLLQEIEDKSNESTRNVSTQKQYVQSTLDHLCWSLRFSKKAYQSSDSIERIQMNTHAIDGLERATETMWNFHTIEPPLILHGFDNLVQTVGLRKFSGKDVTLVIPPQHPGLFGCLPTMSLECPGLGKKTELEVRIKPKMIGEPRFQIQYGSTFQVSSWPESKLKSDGTWTIEFTPRCGGNHRVTVYIRGVWVTNGTPTFTVTGEPKVGAEVQRGPDWDQGNEDGGEGHTGKVMSVEPTRAGGRKNRYLAYYDIKVKWDSGSTHSYHWGELGKYQIELAIRDDC